jgi:hypothetical protein
MNEIGDKLFHRKSGEPVGDWYARVMAMNDTTLS